MSAHALLGASSAHRWLTCPPSARLEESLGIKDKGSAFAEEGTAAHAYAELVLQHRLGTITNRSFGARLKAHKATPWWGPEMEDCIEDYANQIMEIVEDLKTSGYTPYVDLEQRVDYSAYVPGGFGTADVVILADDVLHIIDLKYGKGVPVSAEGNPQLRLYALGAALKYEMIFTFKQVRMTIIQPRLESTSTDSLPREYLMDWAKSYVAPRAALADKGEGEFCPDEHACRWCKAKAMCRARVDENLAVAQKDFAPPELLSIDEVAELLPQLSQLELWAKDVQEWALIQARDHNTRFSGYKLVEGRSNRKIIDAEAAIEQLYEHEFNEDEFLKPRELMTITALEKLLGKATFTDVLGDYVIKPTGKPVLVTESDRRPEINSIDGARQDFKA